MMCSKVKVRETFAGGGIQIDRPSCFTGISITMLTNSVVKGKSGVDEMT